MKAKFRKALEDRDKSIAYDSENLTVERYLMEHWLVHARKREVEGTYRPYEAIVRLAVPCSPVADAVLLTHICSSGSMLEVGKGSVGILRKGESTEGGTVEETAVVDRRSFCGCVDACACCCGARNSQPYR